MKSQKLIVCGLALMFAVVFCPRLQAQRGSGDEAVKQTIPDDWMENFEWRSIGPANMSGRITALAVYEKDSRIWFAASASGGLLKTTNNGINFEHVFDDQATVSIGDVQICQTNPDIVWVGTGEANPRNSVSWGNGVYKSTDGGKTWKNMGLEKSFQIGRIAIHPENPDVVYVGALGRLWGPNQERGLYKTTDGGKKWEKIHFIDENTGVIDIEMHPKDPDTMLVATYERKRDGFDGNDPVKKYGEGSGLYRTTDGGKTFTRVTEGMPSCKLGRIGLDWYQKNPNFVYAIVESEKIAAVPENQGYAGVTGQDADVGAKITDVVEDSPAQEAGLKVDDIVVQVDGKIVHSYNDFLAELRRRKSGDEVKLAVSRGRKAETVKMVLGKQPERRGRRGRRGGSVFTGTLGGQAANLQGQQGGENEEEYGGVYMSKDGGVSWTRINTLNPRPMYYSQVRVDPSNKDNLYVLGTSLYRSSDGGETFTGDGGRGAHPDNHALWIDPQQGDHMILGNDGGIYVTWDRMDNWDHYNHVAIGQFYHVGIDHTRDYMVYGGLQDNGSWGGPAQTRSEGPVNSDWIRVGGGDGFITLVDPTDKDQIYFESQNGAMGRNNLRTGERGFIRPRPPRGTRYRFNWKTPFVLSPHNPKIHYSAGNYVFRSFDKGNGIEAISPEITNTDKGAGSAISESPVKAGVIYVGTTDGALWVSRDHGQNWQEIFVQKEEKQEPSEDEEEESESSESESSESSSEGGEAETSEAEEAEPAGEAGRGERARGRRGEGRGGAGRRSGQRRPRDRGEGSGEASRESAESEAESAMEEQPPSKQPAESKPDPETKTDPATKTDPETKTDPKPEKPLAGSKLVGQWKGEMDFDQIPEGERWVEMKVEQADDGSLSGVFTTPRSVSRLTEFKWDPDTGKLSFSGANDSIDNIGFAGKLDDQGQKIEGQIDMGRIQIDFFVKKVDDPVSVTMPAAGYQWAAHRMVTTWQDEDPVTGTWSATMEAEEVGGTFEFTLLMKLDGDGNVTGMISSAMGEMEIYDGTFDQDSGKLRMEVSSEESGMNADVVATIKDGSLSGTLTAGQGQFEVEFTAQRTSSDAPQDKPAQPNKQETPAEALESKTEESAAPSATASQSEQKQESSSDAVTAAEDDPLTGRWEGKIISDSQFMQGDRSKLAMTLIRGKAGKISGFVDMMQDENEIGEGTFKAEDNSVTFLLDNGRFELDFSAVIKEDKMTGEVDFGGRRSFNFEASRVSTTANTAAATQEATKVADKEGSQLGDLLPGPRWVSSLEASRYKAGRVYVTLDGHRSNDDEPYVFVSEDFGKNWSSLRANLPTSAGSTRVIREDIENENLLFLGCEFSAWVSVDRGQSWTRFQGGLPTVAVHEFAIHPSSGEIVAGTHGRSLWVCDITGLRELSTEAMQQSVTLLKPNSVVRWRRTGERGSSGNRRFVGENPDSNAEIFYHLGEDVRDVTLTIHNLQGELIRTLDASASTGLNRVVWDLRGESSQQQQGRGGRRGGATVPAGQYLVTLSAAGREFKEVLEIQQDPSMPASAVSAEEWELMKDLAGWEEEDEPDQ